MTSSARRLATNTEQSSTHTLHPVWADYTIVLLPGRDDLRSPRAGDGPGSCGMTVLTRLYEGVSDLTWPYPFEGMARRAAAKQPVLKSRGQQCSRYYCSWYTFGAHNPFDIMSRRAATNQPELQSRRKQGSRHFICRNYVVR